MGVTGWVTLGVVAFIIVVCYAASSTRRTARREVAGREAKRAARQADEAALKATKARLTVKLARADKTLKATWSTLLKGGE